MSTKTIETRVQQQFGEVKAESAPLKPKRESFIYNTCGDLSIQMGTIQWVSREDPTKYQDPTVVWEGTVAKFTNAKGYMVPFVLSDDPVVLRETASAFIAAADLIEKYDLKLNKTGTSNVDTSRADEFFARQK